MNDSVEFRLQMDMYTAGSLCVRINETYVINSIKIKGYGMVYRGSDLTIVS